MTLSTPPATILVGIPLDADESKELLSRAISTVAHPHDTVVALHVLEASKNPVGQGKKKSKMWQSLIKHQTQIRQAKAFVISVVAELVESCRAKQVNVEARVGFGSSTGKGLIEEAENIAADFLIVGSESNQSNRQGTFSFIKFLLKKLSRITCLPFESRASSTITKYCCKHIPEGCSLVLLRKTGQLQGESHSTTIQTKGKCDSSSEEKPILTKIRRGKPSPRTVLDVCEIDSESTEECSSSSEESSMTRSPLLDAAMSLQSDEYRKPMSPLKHISSFFRLSFDSNGRKRCEAIQAKEKQQPSFRCFSYEEIAAATNKFHPDNLVGQGGYSEVYRGDLRNGQTIAVKRLAKDNTDAKKEKEFLMEIGIIGHVNHPNTANLVGCCIENGLYLVFKFYPNGTLSSALHGKTGKSLDWPVRYRIALGVARGLHYLHKCCKHRIIHRDIKASNVLLGPDYEPQISDFGLAKWLPNKWTHHAVIPIEGTFGYLAPEYFMHGIVDEKTDVFAFGVLLLEIVTGRRPVDSSKQNLILWAKPLMESGKINELVDPKLEDKYDADQLHRLVLTASYCIRQTSVWRPSTTEILELLTIGHDSELGRSWRIPKFTSEEMDDYSMVFGYQVPSNLALEEL